MCKAKKRKIEILKEEYAKLQATIQSESERLSFITRKEELEKNVKSTLEELYVIESELQTFDESVVKWLPAEKVQKLREWVEAKRRGDVVIRIWRSQFVIKREQIMYTPFLDFGFTPPFEILGGSGHCDKTHSSRF
jgi:predicted nuclease with TOPRIM domain